MSFAGRIRALDEVDLIEKEYRLGSQDLTEEDGLDEDHPVWHRTMKLKGGGLSSTIYSTTLCLSHFFLLAFGVFFLQAGAQGLQNAEAHHHVASSQPANTVSSWWGVRVGVAGGYPLSYWLCVMAVLFGFLLVIQSFTSFWALKRWNEGRPALLRSIHATSLLLLIFFVSFTLLVIGFWDDHANVSNQDPLSITLPLQTNPLDGPNKFWLVMLSSFTSLVLVLNLCCYLGLNDDDDLPVVKPTLFLTSAVLLAVGTAIVILIVYTMLTTAQPATTTPISSTSSASSSSTTTPALSELPNTLLQTSNADSNNNPPPTTSSLSNLPTVNNNIKEQQPSLDHASLSTTTSTSTLPVLTAAQTPAALDPSGKDFPLPPLVGHPTTHAAAPMLATRSASSSSSPPAVVEESVTSFLSLNEEVVTSSSHRVGRRTPNNLVTNDNKPLLQRESIPSLGLSPSLPSLSSNVQVLESSFLASTHSVLLEATSKANWKEEWPLYLTLGAGCGLILEGLMGLLDSKRVFFPLLVLLPAMGALAGVSAGTSFFIQQPTTLVAIADLVALGAQLFTILAFVSVYMLRRSTLNSQNNYYSKLVQYEF